MIKSYVFSLAIALSFGLNANADFGLAATSLGVASVATVVKTKRIDLENKCQDLQPESQDFILNNRDAILQYKKNKNLKSIATLEAVTASLKVLKNDPASSKLAEESLLDFASLCLGE